MQRPTPRDVLQRRLRQTAAERDTILREDQAQQAPVVPARPSFFDHVVQVFYEGSEERMFADLNINRAVFYTALNLVDSVPLQRRGRPSFVSTHKDKLLFLLVFLTNGTGVLETLCLPRLTSVAGVLHHIHDAAVLLARPLTRNMIQFRHERAQDLPLVSTVVDCTVVEINGPDTPFGEKDTYYSGKHKRHCLKKEVIVNVRSGMAAMVSKEHPGSVSDIEVLRRHAAEVNEMLGESKMLADKGYRGDTLVPNCQVVSNENQAEVNARLIVERFFGRLKNHFIVFSRRWELSPRCFSLFFDLTCAIVNMTILVSPLNQEDWIFNNNLMAKWKREREEREERERRKREAAKTRRLAERETVLLSIIGQQG